MTELFDMPETPPDRLTLARAEYARAMNALEDAEAADEEFDGCGVPHDIEAATMRARVELKRAELEALRDRKQTL